MCASGAWAPPQAAKAEGSSLARDPVGPFGVLAEAFMVQNHREALALHPLSDLARGLETVSAEYKKGFGEVF